MPWDDDEYMYTIEMKTPWDESVFYFVRGDTPVSYVVNKYFRMAGYNHDDFEVVWLWTGRDGVVEPQALETNDEPRYLDLNGSDILILQCQRRAIPYRSRVTRSGTEF
jgi:hypothetical protein